MHFRGGLVTALVVGLATGVVGVHPASGVQKGSFDPGGKTHTSQLLVTVCAGGSVREELVVGAEVMLVGVAIVVVGMSVELRLRTAQA